MRSLKTQIRQRVRDRAYKALRARGLESLCNERHVPLTAITAHLMHTLPPGVRDLDDWHVDHILPLAAFCLERPDQCAAAFAPTNHRWRGARENLSKGATYDPRQVMRALYPRR